MTFKLGSLNNSEREKKNLESRRLTTNNVAKDTILIIIIIGIGTSWTKRSGEWIRRSEMGRVEMGGQNGNSSPRCFFNGHIFLLRVVGLKSETMLRHVWNKKQRPRTLWFVCFFVMCAQNTEEGGCIYSILSIFAACVALLNECLCVLWTSDC